MAGPDFGACRGTASSARFKAAIPLKRVNYLLPGEYRVAVSGTGVIKFVGEVAQFYMACNAEIR
jgi:hypothetical protein